MVVRAVYPRSDTTADSVREKHRRDTSFVSRRIKAGTFGGLQRGP